MKIYIEVRGNRIRAQFGGRLVFDVIDENFPKKGSIALVGHKAKVKVISLKIEKDNLLKLPDRGW